MIYLDNAATTLQKPLAVCKAMEQALLTCANPGRSGHTPAMKAGEIVFACREAAAELFGMNAPERVVFTQNATHALNLAIKSLLWEGGHAVLSGYEHNSVVRPLEAMRERGVSYTVASAPLFDETQLCLSIADSIRADTKCVIVTQVSNVFGFALPMERINAICREHRIPMIVDASQAAGVLPVRADQWDAAAFICMPGHKGLYGPQGTGMLLCCGEHFCRSLIEGGTGSLSIELTQPDFLPDALESGTLNVPGIAGLLEGIRFVLQKGKAIRQKESVLLRQTAEDLSVLPETEVFYHPSCQSGVLSFRNRRLDPAEISEYLNQKGICVRSGLHCAPVAHRTGGTLPEGTVRLSFSAFNTKEEEKRLLWRLNEWIKIS